MIVYVILHYKNYELTKNSILSLSDLYGENKIIVVDNGSNNGSLEKLINDFNNVDFIYQNENLGFAMGNNIGYSYAKLKYDPDFIVCMNNDITIDDLDFSLKVEDIFSKCPFHILGPKIVNSLGENQNPYNNCLTNMKMAKKFLRKLKFKLLIKKFSYKISKKRKYVIDKTSINEDLIGKPLHGAFMIFSKKFIKENNVAFYPFTFLYGEEDILYNLCEKKGYILLYSPKLVVLHHDMPDNCVSYEKYVFLLNNKINSIKCLLKIMEE